MSTPRQLVRDYILTRLIGITKAGGYALDVQTAERTQKMLRDYNLSDLPACLLQCGNETEERAETLGGQRANGFFREWNMRLFLRLADRGNSNDIEDAGEIFLAAVIRALIVGRSSISLSNTSVNLRDIRYDVKADEFERMENGISQYVMDLRVRYDFSVGDLS